MERKEVYSDLWHGIACRAQEKTHTTGPEEKEQPVDRGANELKSVVILNVVQICRVRLWVCENLLDTESMST